MDDSCKRAAAKERWKILGNALRGRKSSTSGVSVRRFANFNLFGKVHLDDDHDSCLVPAGESSTGSGGDHFWMTYKWLKGPCPEMRIRHLKETVTAKEMMGFNNTGNVCVWPSEEILAHYLLSAAAQFRDKSVCELGGGMTCLAGLMLATAVPLGSVVLTDGNERSADNVTRVLAAGAEHIMTPSFSARCLQWDRSCPYDDLRDQFDYLVCADCFFFTDFHLDLLHVVKTLLKRDGKAIFFAPRRAGTLAKFTDLAAKHFSVSVSQEYDQFVSEQRQLALSSSDSGYSDDLHYPLLVEMTFKQ